MNDFLYGANCPSVYVPYKSGESRKNADMIMQDSCYKLVININVVSFNPKRNLK